MNGDDSLIEGCLMVCSNYGRAHNLDGDDSFGTVPIEFGPVFVGFYTTHLVVYITWTGWVGSGIGSMPSPTQIACR